MNKVYEVKQVIDELVNENEMLQDKVYKLEDIIKEVREYIENDTYRIGFMNANGKPTRENHILEILDKVKDNK